MTDSQVRSSKYNCNRDEDYCGISLISRRARRSGPLFHDDTVGPFHKGDEDCQVAELGAPLIQIRFRDPTGPGAGPSRKDRNVLGDNFVERFAERRPADRQDRIGHGLSHQRRGFRQQEDLHIVTGLG